MKRTAPKSKATIAVFPREPRVLVLIFHMLVINLTKNIHLFFLVCKSWTQIFYDEGFWQQICEQVGRRKAPISTWRHSYLFSRKIKLYRNISFDIEKFSSNFLHAFEEIKPPVELALKFVQIMKSIQIHKFSKFEKREAQREREAPCPRGVYSAETTTQTFQCVVDFVVKGELFCFAITAVDTKEDEVEVDDDDSNSDHPDHIPRGDLNTQLEISWLDGEKIVLIFICCNGHNKDEEYGHTYAKIMDKNMPELSEKLQMSNVLSLQFLVFCLGFPAIIDYVDDYEEVFFGRVEGELNQEMYKLGWPKQDILSFYYNATDWPLSKWEGKLLGKYFASVDSPKWVQ